MISNLKIKYFSFLYILLIASLPFFSVRPSFLSAGSFSLYILILIAISVLANTVVSGKTKLLLSPLDYFIILLIFLSSVSSLFVSSNNVIPLLLKTMLYFYLYLSLKSILLVLPSQFIEEATRKGVIFGMATFVLFVSYALHQTGGVLSIFTSFDYFNFTYKIYESINTLISDDEFSSRDIMRNSLGEVFSFYFVFILVYIRNRKQRFNDWFSLLFSVLFVLATFSRRAFMSSVLTFSLMMYKILKKNIYIFLGLYSIISYVIYYIVFKVSLDNRLVTLTSEGRENQFSLAADALSNSWFFGLGYGEKLYVPTSGEEVYIHNFIFSNFYMLGIFGLILSSIIFIYVFRIYIKSFARDMDYGLLMIIPIFGMLVGGTTEGMFTTTSWIILALISAYREKYVPSKKNKPKYL